MTSYGRPSSTATTTTTPLTTPSPSSSPLPDSRGLDAAKTTAYRREPLHGVLPFCWRLLVVSCVLLATLPLAIHGRHVPTTWPPGVAEGLVGRTLGHEGKNAVETLLQGAAAAAERTSGGGVGALRTEFGTVDLLDEEEDEDDGGREPTTTTTPLTTLQTTTWPASRASWILEAVAPTEDSMSPVQPTAYSVGGSTVALFLLAAAVALAALGALACILGSARMRAGSARSRDASPALLGSHANLPMLQLPEERLKLEEAAGRDRAVRLASVRADLRIDLPPCIRLPDGEGLPYGCADRIRLRDPEQESELLGKCIRAPPNRTVFERESPPPYRSRSAGALPGADWSTGTQPNAHWPPAAEPGVHWPTGAEPGADWPTDAVQRCHSVGAAAPARPRRLSAFGVGPGLAQLTMLACRAPPV